MTSHFFKQKKNMGKNVYVTRVVSTGWIHFLKLVYPPAARSQQPSFEGFAGRAHRLTEQGRRACQDKRR